MDKKKKILALAAVVLVGGLAALSATGGINGLKSSAIQEESPSNISDEQIKTEIAQYDLQISALEKNKSDQEKANVLIQERAQQAGREWKKAEKECLPILWEKDKLDTLQSAWNQLIKERNDIKKTIASLTGKEQLNSMTISSNKTKIATLKNNLKKLNKKSPEYTNTTTEINRLEDENKSLDISYQKNQLALYEDTIDAKTKKVTKKGKINVKQDEVNTQEFKMQQLNWKQKCLPYLSGKQSEQVQLDAYAKWTGKVSEMTQQIQDLKSKQDELKKKLTENKSTTTKNDEDELTSELLTELKWKASKLEETINEIESHIADFDTCETNECKNNFYTWWIEYKPQVIHIREILWEFFANVVWIQKTYAYQEASPLEISDAYAEAQAELSKARDAYEKAKEKMEEERARLKEACETWKLPECNIACTGEDGKTKYVKSLNQCHNEDTSCYDKYWDYLTNWMDHMPDWIVAHDLWSCLDFCAAKRNEWDQVGQECTYEWSPKNAWEDGKAPDYKEQMYNKCVTTCNDRYYTPPTNE